MKKITAICILLVSMLAMSACSKDAPSANNGTTNDNTNNTVQQEVSGETQQTEQPIDTIISDDGTKFTVNTDKTGVIASGADAISGTHLTINGKSYNFPMKVSALMNDGWRLPQGVSFKNEFEANTTTNLVSFYLNGEVQGNQLDLEKVFNETTETTTLEGCLLTKIEFDAFDWRDAACDFILPGGITKNSTAADVIKVFGNPNNTTDFERGYNFDDQLTYEKHNSSGLTFTFTFNDDGTIYSANITQE